MKLSFRAVVLAGSVTASIGCAAVTVDSDAGAGAAGGGGGAGGAGGPPDAAVIVFPDALAPSPLPGTGGTSVSIPEGFKYFSDGKDKGAKDPLLPNDVKDRFGGARATEAPVIAYPLTNSMRPINLGAIAFHWRRGSWSAATYRLSIVFPDGNYHFFITCRNGLTAGMQDCMYTLPADDWLNMALTHRGGSATATLYETDGKGGPVGASAPLTLHFSPESVNGALYYWSAALRSLKRATFGAKAAAAYITPKSATNDFECAGCHSVSRDGKVVAFGVDSEPAGYPTGIRITPTDTPERPYVKPELSIQNGKEQPTNRIGSNVALNTDGSLAVVNNWPALELWDARTGDKLQSIEHDDAMFQGYYMGILPEWSPDGSRITVTLTKAESSWDFFTDNGTIGVLEFDKGARRFTSGRVLVRNANNDGTYHFYPTWSPDGKWIAFVSAPKPVQSGESSSGNRNTILRLVSTEGGPHACPGAACVDLVNGQQYTTDRAFVQRSAVGSTWPKFTPFAMAPMPGAPKDVMWITVSSRAAYGLVSYENTSTQLWMFAIDVRKARMGMDPSYPPLWLPYQDPKDASLEGFWTEKLVCDIRPDGTCNGCVNGELCGTALDGSCFCYAQPPG